MILLDTDVVSYIFKRHPAAELFVGAFEDYPLWICFMTVAEIEHGMAAAKWGERARHRMRRHLGRYEVCESNPEVCRLWGAVREESTAKGRPMSQQDAWIAATALHLGMPLATNNRRHFHHLDRLQLLVA